MSPDNGPADLDPDQVGPDDWAQAAEIIARLREAEERDAIQWLEEHDGGC